MDMTLSRNITNLIYRGINLLQGFNNELTQTNSLGTLFTKNLLIEGAGEIASNIFETNKARKYGKKLASTFFSSNIKESQEAITAKYLGMFNNWENDAINFLQNVSLPVKGLASPGNSYKLVNRIKRAGRYKKLETRIQHVIFELQSMQKEGLVYNSSLPQPMQQKIIVLSSDSKQILEHLEKELRKFIERELSKYSKNWWNERIPLFIRNNAENRKSRRENIWQWYPPTSNNVIDYLDFSDYRKIITDTENWKEIFIQFFKTESFIEVRLGELEPIRNDLAHSRIITQRTINKIRIYSEELFEIIKDRNKPLL